MVFRVSSAYLYPASDALLSGAQKGGTIMKTWMKPSVREQEVGLEVTSYLPAEIDII
ncbi:coenzyme PQQ biosynthesis protein A [Hyphomicrobium nitrativorans NL23]|uniref:Coenzyme PQQ synthesis protein A n=1 Tax=Hyphomicrobium nitrativorans NL23 TaxID=1029756 RepID=V5SB53_9HYPH|nr:coenzyme PQQ biosynthesis protein A [Hyphomicrobium nitrativorans NL23]